MKHPSSISPSSPSWSRRRFLGLSAGAAGAAITFPSLFGATDKSGSRPVVIGAGSHTYECHHGWGKLPSHLTWGETHGVAVDSQGFVYIKHNTGPTKRVQDSIVVFDPEGQYVRSFGEEYHGGGHGIDLRKEGSEEFLYLCSTRQRLVTKTTLKGDIVWACATPGEPGVYKEGKNFVPTNVAFAPDGGFFVGDGYGSNYIHRFDAKGKWLQTWGGTGTKPGEFKTPHGLWWDDRKNLLCVCDRANARLQYFQPDGTFVSLVEGLLFPAHLDTKGDVLLCPDLHARVTLFDRDNQVIAHLGEDPEWRKQVLDGFKIRSEPGRWQPGKFIHPHDACFDSQGNIFVVEWVATGRVTKLKKLA
ncbi:MAG: peptidase [Verrucomicrobia bacterium]|nr:peptidase [Verrucomicrobiota bacterium]